MKTITVLAALLFSTSILAQGPEAPPAGPKNATSADATATPNTVKDTVQKDVKGTIKTAKVFFVEPKDGATVGKTFAVKMGVEGIKIRPAGEAPDEMTSGHHHLIVNGPATPAGQVIPADEKHIHFGKGQTETTLTLAPGDYTLTLQFADGAHRSFGPKMSQSIKVKVK